MHRPLDPAELQPADILLCRGTSEVAQSILNADGGNYSHAALWTGTDVIESTLPAVRRVSLTYLRKESEHIDIYRYRNLKDPQVVVDHALAYEGQPYASLQLVLSGLLLTVSSWMPNDWSEMATLYGAGTLERMLRALRRAKDKIATEQAATGQVTCAGLIVCAYRDGNAPISIQLQAGRQIAADAFLRTLRGFYERMAASRNQTTFARATPFETQVVDDAILSELYWLRTIQEPPVPGNMRFGEPDPMALQRSWQLWAGLATPVDHNPEQRLGDLSAGALRQKRLIAGLDWAHGLVTPRQLEFSAELECVGRIAGLGA